MKFKRYFFIFMWVGVLIFAGTSVQAGDVNYTYDALNRLTVAEKPGEYRIEYSYDAAGNRTYKVVELTVGAAGYGILDAEDSSLLASSPVQQDTGSD
ncbi:MAG: RHS repeat protein [Deltaproteobacteria bacterium]|nr:RHS repeat protein [Deltaproteobacteria bacterium]MBW2011658.1 RHS repeat protein [Deltaproteobacteria bacterium]